MVPIGKRQDCSQQKGKKKKKKACQRKLEDQAAKQAAEG